MSLFFDYRVDAPHKEDTLIVAWCKGKSILAVASSDNKILFYQEEGELIEDCSYERKCNATAMAWQPRGKLLAIGWEDGVVTLWNSQDRVARDSTAVHNAKVRFAEWSPSGNRFVTGDQDGTIGVWRAETRGHLSPVSQYRKQGAMTHCVFLPPPPTPRGRDTLSKAITPSTFFAGGEEGIVVFADDMKHCHDVQNIQVQIDAMLFYEEKKRLIILTRSLLMIQLQVGDNGLISPVMKVKLSVTGAMKQVAWAGPGLLATASVEEKMIRFWDLAGDENYVLQLSTAGSSVAHTDKVQSIAFNPRKRVLSAGTLGGKVCMWKFQEFSNDEDSKSSSSSSSSSSSRNRNGRPKFGPTSAANWDPMLPISVAGPVKSLEWGPGEHLLAAGMPQGTSILNETVLRRKLHDEMAAVQLSADKIALEEPNGRVRTIETGVRIKGLHLDSRHVVVWNGKKVEVYSTQNVRMVTSFESQATSIVVCKDSLFQARGNQVEVCNHAGNVKHSVTFTEQDGAPIHLDFNDKYLAVATSTGRIKIFSVVGSGAPKLLGSGGHFEEPDEEPEAEAEAEAEAAAAKENRVSAAPKYEIGPGGGRVIGDIRSIRVNADGTKVSLLSDCITGGSTRILQPDSKLYIYDADTDKVLSYEFGQHRFPISHAWDPTEPKLLAAESQKAKNAPKGKGKASSTPVLGTGGTSVGSPSARDKAASKNGATDKDDSKKQKQKNEHETEVTTMFCTPEHGIMMQDRFQMDPTHDALLGLKVPRLYFMAKLTEDANGDGTAAAPVVAGAKGSGSGVGTAGAKGTAGSGSGSGGAGSSASGEPQSRLKSRVMRDFVGLETVDGETRTALLDFSFYLTIGNMDEAYKAVKLIKSASVWENMAHMCVKTKRLDVAEVCLGNMGHARGARAVREAKKEPEPEATVAMVAIQLGLLDDAVRLYKECGRHDLLNKLYQSAGQWDRALDVAHTQDRIHLKTTHFNYAKHLESIGDTANAIKNYERSDTHRKEVPRLLFDAQYVDDLEQYINQFADKELLKWWAQYCESNGYFEKASHFYQRAEDHLSLVRVACYNREFQKAAEIVRETNSSAAAYHLARQHESSGNVQEAINYFSRAGRYNHAIRLAKEHGLDRELAGFALQSNSTQMLETAEYFEKKGAFEKAVNLYQKGGNVPRALDLCFRAELFDVLRTIASDLSGSDTSPETLRRCGEFFMEHGQYEKAVQLFVTAKKYHEALDLCMQHKIKITEEMAESMTIAKVKGMSAEDNDNRVQLLEKVAKCCKKQGSYHLATKKYTQSGDKLKAMKCLLKSGDTEKIIFFAGVSRNQKIYILAANYLQNLDWHNDPEIMKAIINFYTKAKAFEQLSGFYDACAQVEIDEYRDYEKALGALKEAVKYMIKAKVGNKEESLASLQQRIGLVEQFVQARRLVKTDPAEMVKICHQLLDRPDVETAIRVGDGFALLIEFYYAQRNMEQAYRLIEKMRERHIILNPYLDQDMINNIYQAVGVAVEKPAPARGADDDEVEDDMEEDIVEEGDD